MNPTFSQSEAAGNSRVISSVARALGSDSSFLQIFLAISHEYWKSLGSVSINDAINI